MNRWTRCLDRYPPPLPDTLQDWRTESAWVLVRTARGEAWVARHCVMQPDFCDGEDVTGQWVARGPDGYTLDDVIEWMEVPA